jgi:hypothetical protein
MSAAPTPAALPHLPDPPPDRPVPSAQKPSRAGRLLNVLRKLIGYGKEVAAALQKRVSPCPCSYHLVTVTRNFGTADIGLILASITRALLRATALEARLVSRGDRPDDAPVTARARRRQTPTPSNQTTG